MKTSRIACGIVFSIATLHAAVLTVNFDLQNEGVYTETLAYTDFPTQDNQAFWSDSWYELNYGRGSIVVDEVTHSKVLRVKYPAGCVGPNDASGCGIQIKYPLADSAETMWLSYQLFFEDGFDFVKGGKLPGLCGGKCYTGGNIPATGDGWSARIMWRTGGAIVQYLYFVDQTATYGDDAKWNLKGAIAQKIFVPGIWHTVVTKVVLNSVSAEGAGSKDGKIKSWFDGDLALDLDTLRLRDFGAQRIDKFYFSTFHGGSDASWAPTVDSYVRYDNIVASKDSIPVSGGSVGLSTIKKLQVRSETPKIILGNYFQWKKPLSRNTLFCFYGIDGRMRFSQWAVRGDTEMKLPLFQEVLFWKAQ